MNPEHATQEQPQPFPRIRQVPFSAPLRWLTSGIDDMKHCPRASFFYGACFAVMGLLLRSVFRNAYEYTSALTAGFLLVGPYLCIGLYDISRRRQEGQSCDLVPTLTAWKPNVGAIGIYSLILTVIMLVWARASLVTFALFYTSEMPSLQGFLKQVLSWNNLEFLFIYFLVGGLFATLVFCTSVISIPMLLERNQDAVTAVIASFASVVRNIPAMLLWAVLIVVLTMIGFATLFIGLIITAPLIGHATWHAYRHLVEPAVKEQ
jgi:uncharacterized membrane protein